MISPTSSRTTPVSRSVSTSPAGALEARSALDDRRSALARSRPFAGHSPALLEWLAERARAEEYEAGDEILSLGEAGEACYIIAVGQVELLGVRGDGTTYQLAEIGAGDIFGVEALVTGTSQLSTARGQTHVSVLRLARQDFTELLARYPDCAPYFFLLARQRTRPRHSAEVVAFPAPDNQPGVILKDCRRYRYLRLSEPGHYLWTLMDGERTVRDLSLAYFVRYQRFGVDEVLRTIAELLRSGFVDAPDVQPHLLRLVTPRSRRAQLVRQLAAVSQRTFALPDPDRAIDTMYRFGLRLVYTVPAQLAIAIVALVGLAVFAYTLGSGRPLAGGTTALAGFLGLELQVFLHELAHTATTKHFGREVHRVGVGWYLFLPIAFVDTSDMWLEPRWRRIAVAAAGPYLNLVLAGAASCLLLVVPGGLTAPFMAFAATGYLLAGINLNPLYELDGYYVLSDLLSIPNLRSSALAYLGARLWRVPAPSASRRQQRIFFGYGVAAGGYAVAAAGALLIGYHHLVERFAAEVLPSGLSAVLGWMLAAAMAALLLVNLWQRLRQGVDQARSAIKGEHSHRM